MQIELVSETGSTQSNGGFVAQKQPVESRHLLRHLNIQRGWKVLVLTIVNEDDVSFLARCVGHQGELVMLDSDSEALNRLECQKRNGDFRSTKLMGKRLNPAFCRPKRVALPVAVL